MKQMHWTFGAMILLICFLPLPGISQQLLKPHEKPYTLRQDEPQPEWITRMYSPDPDPGDVIQLYESYYATHPFVKNQHTQYYKRWLTGLGRQLVPNPYWDSVYLAKTDKVKNKRSVANWTTIGPIDWDHDAASRSYAPGSAHVYTVEQSVSTPNTLYAGTANAGIWKSTNRGLSWTATTNGFLTGSVVALEINPTNANIVYAELMSNIYKTTNGGTTWTPTGDAPFQSLSMSVRDIRCKPDAPTTVFAATDEGLFRTTNSGTTWTNVLAGDMLEIEFHPTRPDTIYAVRRSGSITQFFRSFDNGNNFSQQITGWPSPNVSLGEHQERTELAVSADAPDNVYALATGSANGGSGLYGVYYSTNAGSSWTFQCCGPQPAGPPSATNMNLMGWNDQGLDDGGQYYYDLAFGVSPYNKDSMWVCGVQTWVSGNEGDSFVCPAAWSHSHKPNYVHADIHDFHYYAHTGEIWIACDGGIFYSNDRGANFQRRNVGIAGSDFWGFGMGHWYGDVMLGGAYHNGTLLKEENTYLNGWICTDGGDGVGGYVNPGYDRQAYSNYNIKHLKSNRTISPETRTFQYQPNSTYIVGQSSRLLFHPNYYGTWYSGSDTKLYLTRDNGYSFEVVHDFGVDVAMMDLCLSDPNVMYVCTFPDWWGIKRIYRTEDAGETWTEITPSNAVINNTGQWVPYDIAVDPDDPMRLWIVRTSMYNGYPSMNGYTVFTSSNGGTTWTNISGAGLNGQYPTCLMQQRGTNGGIYIGTRQGVYYRNDDMPDWELFNNGLPARTHNVKMLPWYRKGKLRTATDRSVWESSFYENSEPVAIPGVQKQYLICHRDTARFVDLSVIHETNATWSWNFPGGTPETSTLRNPKVVYNQPGIYDVTLIVQDIHGTDTTTMQGLIVADSRCRVDTVPGGAMQTVVNPDHARINDFNVTTQSMTITAWVKPNGIQPDYAAIWMNDGTAAGMNFREGNNTLGYHWPGGQWWWDSNLIVPPGEWSYVAMVVQPGSVRMYVNGVGATHNIAIQSVNLTDIRIGSYQGWNDRNFNGEIDEVCVWNRALSEDEIRLQRHLIKNPEADGDIIGYYQFDMVSTSIIADKASGIDGTLSGSAQLVRSRAPVGAGTSQIKTISATGNSLFTAGGDMEIGFTSPHPNGKFVVSHLHVTPDTMPLHQQQQGGYWIMNNYGSNQSISNFDSITFHQTGSVSDMMAEDFGFRIYQRTANQFIQPWRPVFADPIHITPGVDAILEGDNAQILLPLGQFLIMRDTVGYGVADVSITHAADTTTWVRGGESIGLLLHSDHQGLRLPVLDVNGLNALGAPQAGQMTFLSDSAAIIYFTGNAWRYISAEPVLQFNTTSAPPSIATLGYDIDSPVPSSLMYLENGFVQLPVFPGAAIAQIESPAAGMLIFDESADVIRMYNGQQWKSLASSPTSLLVSTQPALDISGMAVNTDTRYPSSSLEIHHVGNKAFQLPVVPATQIYAPQAGLCVYDPVRQAMMVFDGLRWSVL